MFYKSLRAGEIMGGGAIERGEGAKSPSRSHDVNWHKLIIKSALFTSGRAQRATRRRRKQIRIPKCLTNSHDFGMRRATVSRGNRPNEVTLINHGAVLLRELCSSGGGIRGRLQSSLSPRKGHRIV